MKARAAAQYLGVKAVTPPDLQIATRAPTSADKAYPPGQLWLNKTAGASYQWSGTAWITLGTV